MLTERDLVAIGKDLLDSDPDRGVALLSAERRVLYANTAAGNMLRDGTPRALPTPPSTVTAPAI